MNFLEAMTVSSSGLSAQRFRMGILAANLANAESTRTPEGGPYRRRDVVFAALPAQRTFEQELRDRVTPEAPRHAKVLGVAIDQRPPILRYEPSHPDADDQGYVAMPRVSRTEEMTNLLLARRAYQANVAAFNSTKYMAMRALELGQHS